jgi:hypothetical protein
MVLYDGYEWVKKGWNDGWRMPFKGIRNLKIKMDPQ